MSNKLTNLEIFKLLYNEYANKVIIKSDVLRNKMSMLFAIFDMSDIKESAEEMAQLGITRSSTSIDVLSKAHTICGGEGVTLKDELRNGYVIEYIKKVSADNTELFYKIMAKYNDEADENTSVFTIANDFLAQVAISRNGEHPAEDSFYETISEMGANVIINYILDLVDIQAEKKNLSEDEYLDKEFKLFGEYWDLLSNLRS